MNAYKTYIQIDNSNRVVLDNLPFHPGTLVEILVVDQTQQIGNRAEQWRSLMRHVQSLPQSQHISEADITAEIAHVRSALSEGGN